jgi:AraC-like DNA-binding protein
MEYRAKIPVRMVAILISSFFFQQCLSEETDFNVAGFRAFAEGAPCPYCHRQGRMTPSMAVAASQLLASPYHGATERMFFESKALELIVLQMPRATSQPADSSIAGTKDRERLRSAREILIRDLQNPPTLFQLANTVGMVHTKLNRGFRALYGSTVFEYLRRQRLEKSRQLLQEGDMNIAEIAYETGFSSPSHFAKAFSARFGVQPKAFRKEALRHRRTPL